MQSKAALYAMGRKVKRLSQEENVVSYTTVELNVIIFLLYMLLSGSETRDLSVFGMGRSV